jgi:hypothetical protein
MIYQIESEKEDSGLERNKNTKVKNVRNTVKRGRKKTIAKNMYRRLSWNTSNSELSANAFRTNKYNIDSIDDSYIKEDFATR